MRKFLILILLLLTYQLSWPQINLVKNNDFDEFNFIYTGTLIEFAKNWWTAGGSPDYFCKNCTTETMITIPNTYVGFQEPKKGEAFIGLLTYPVREYIQTEMKETLKIGKKYCVSFFVNQPDLMYYATDMIGIHFSKDTSFNNSIFNYSSIEIAPQISNAYNNIISDTLNWIEIKGYFLAEGNERFLTIGNFYNNLLINIDSFSSPNAIFMFAYYFIDDVWVYECEEEKINNDIIIPNAFTPNGDGVNDVFSAEGHNIKSFNGIIINRWGQELYRWTDINNGWDGTYKGKNASAGTYFYIITVGFENDELKNYKGSVFLVR